MTIEPKPMSRRARVARTVALIGAVICFVLLVVDGNTQGWSSPARPAVPAEVARFSR